MLCNGNKWNTFAETMDRQPVLEVRGLSKSYGDFKAVEDVSFTVYSGDVFGFLGPNGAGKSTTLRMMLGLVKPSGGEVRFFGKPLSVQRSQILRNTGAIVEKPDLYGYLSAYDNLRLLGRLSGIKPRENKIQETLQLVGLGDRSHSKVKTFSQGMRQRLGIAQALLHDPGIIILDEPANGLDPQGMVEIRELILKLSREYKKTILLSSHILNEVELVANRMVIISKGKVAVEGEVQKLLGGDDMEVTFETGDPESAANVIMSPEFADIRFHKTDNKLQARMPRERIPQLCSAFSNAGIPIYSVTPLRSLEAYFLSLT